MSMNSTPFLGTSRSVRRAGILISCSTLLACGMGFDVGTHDLGSTDQPSETPPDADTASPSPAEAFASIIGVWVGEAEDPFVLSEDGTPGSYHFPSGSTEIRLTIDDSGASIRFGSGVVPPLEDYERGYPLDANYTSDAQIDAPLLAPIEGFDYVIQAQTAYSEVLGRFSEVLSDGVLRLFYSQNQFLRPWCAAQTPKPAMTAGGYSCLGSQSYGMGGNDCIYAPFDPDAGPDAPLQGSVPVDCGRLYLCEASLVPICQCSVQGCGANETIRSGLVLTVAGDELVGSFSQGVFARADGFATPLGVVRFQREE